MYREWSKVFPAIFILGNLMIVRSMFGGIPVFVDECSRIQHLLARLRVCKHKGRWIPFNQFCEEVFKKEYKKLESL